MTGPQPSGRAGLRRARRRAQVRRTALVLGVLLLLATAFAVWLAVEARGPLPVDEGAGPPAAAVTGGAEPTGD